MTSHLSLHLVVPILMTLTIGRECRVCLAILFEGHRLIGQEGGMNLETKFRHKLGGWVHRIGLTVRGVVVEVSVTSVRGGSGSPLLDIRISRDDAVGRGGVHEGALIVPFNIADSDVDGVHVELEVIADIEISVGRRGQETRGRSEERGWTC
jgi:hypothetical protein